MPHWTTKLTAATLTFTCQCRSVRHLSSVRSLFQGRILKASWFIPHWDLPQTPLCGWATVPFFGKSMIDLSFRYRFNVSISTANDWFRFAWQADQLFIAMAVFMFTVTWFIKQWGRSNLKLSLNSNQTHLLPPISTRKAYRAPPDALAGFLGGVGAEEYWKMKRILISASATDQFLYLPLF